MFSHVLANYQKIVILFWEKTARAFNVVADAFKGYQYYEFNIIKDLVEPSKKLAEIVNKVTKEEPDENKEQNEIDIDKIDTLIDLTESEIKIKQEQEDNEIKVDEANQLIDLMTLNEGSTLKEELKELELLELEKSKRNSKDLKITSSNSLFGAALAKSTSQNLNMGESPIATANQLIDLEMTSSTDHFNIKSFKELINNSNNEFERE